MKIGQEEFSMFNMFKVRSPFGKFLDALDKKHNINGHKLSQLSGVSTTVIYRCANGNSRPKPENAKKIIKACKKFDSSVDIKDFWKYIDL